jgi:gas vesicle protein
MEKMRLGLLATPIIPILICITIVTASSQDSPLSDKLTNLLKRTLDYIKENSRFRETPQDTRGSDEIEGSSSLKDEAKERPVEEQFVSGNALEEEAEKIIEELSDKLKGIKDAAPAGKEFLQESTKKVSNEAAEMLGDVSNDLKEKSADLFKEIKGNFTEKEPNKNAEHSPMDDL